MMLPDPRDRLTQIVDGTDPWASEPLTDDTSREARDLIHAVSTVFTDDNKRRPLQLAIRDIVCNEGAKGKLPKTVGEYVRLIIERSQEPRLNK